ncbi:MAG: hypothetical protein KF703_03865 [Actinobacteria bacterium]|nr:hypothetical protein [Actinomycetota bacterium]
MFATNRFPIESPGLSTTAYWVGGVAGALLFFVSLLVHEVGHALVARDEGIGVRGISLWLLGGVAKLESSPTTARSEFRIAVVGPLASAACGVAFLSAPTSCEHDGIARLTGNLFAKCSASSTSCWPGSTCAPPPSSTAAPCCRHGLAPLSGSRAACRPAMSSTPITPSANHGALSTSPPSRQAAPGSAPKATFLLLVGGFIAFAAYRNLKSLPIYQLLDGATVREAMVPTPPPAAGWATVSDFLAGVPADCPHHAFPALDEHGRVVGLLTAAAVRATPRETWSQLRVVDLAYPLDRITVVAPDEPLLPAVQKIDGGDVRDGLVVAADGTVVGTIGASALYHALDRRRLRIAEEQAATKAPPPPPPPVPTHHR